MSITPSPCLSLFALHLEWFLNTSVYKISNAVCIFANLCSTLVCGLNFLQLGSIFWRNAQTKRKKANRETNVDSTVPTVRKNCNPFLSFPFINSPSQMKIFIYSTDPFPFHLVRVIIRFACENRYVTHPLPPVIFIGFKQ